MKVKATTSQYKGNGAQFEDGWREITPEMAWHFWTERTPSHTSDPVRNTARHEGVTQCRLFSRGDAYSASVWEVR